MVPLYIVTCQGVTAVVMGGKWEWMVMEAVCGDGRDTGDSGNGDGCWR